MIRFLWVCVLSMFLIWRVQAESNVPNMIVGAAYLKKPVVSAKVTIKSLDGFLLDSAVTDSNGRFQISSSYSGQVIAMAVTRSGEKFYGIGRNGLVNITPLSDIILKKWFKANKQSISSIFSKPSKDMMLPSDYDIEALGENILTDLSGLLGLTYLDLIHEPLGSTARQALRVSNISANSGKFSARVGKTFKQSGSITVKPTPDGGVIFNVKSTDVHHPPNQKAYSTRVSYDTSIERIANKLRGWMGQDMAFIGNKRLADIAIPGTHDSGTARVSGLLSSTAKTQTQSIGQQLQDGIRYLDLRVLGVDPNSFRFILDQVNKTNYYAELPCPAITDYYIYHNSDYNKIANLTSYRLNEALSDIKAFVSNPFNTNEVVILDFQNLGYVADSPLSNSQDIGVTGSRWEAVLFQYVQDYLDGYVIKTTSEWSDKPISNLVALQTGKVGGKVILLVGDNYINKPASVSTSNCVAATKPEFWYPRYQRTNGVYNGRATYNEGLKDDIISQLSQSYAQSKNNIELFEKYRAFQSLGYLNTLNFAPLPGNFDYFLKVLNIQTLTEYSEKVVNKPFNAAYASYEDFSLDVSESLCNTGTIGKYAWMGRNYADQDTAGAFNRTNIIMVDNYSSLSPSKPFWVNSEYDELTGKWKQAYVTDFIGFIRNVNKMDRSSFSGQNKISSMQDGACLDGSPIDQHAKNITVKIWGPGTPGTVKLSPRFGQCTFYPADSNGVDLTYCTDKILPGWEYLIEAVPAAGKVLKEWNSNVILTCPDSSKSSVCHFHIPVNNSTDVEFYPYFVSP